MKELEAEMDAEHRRLAESTNIFYLLHSLHTLHMLHICNRRLADSTKTLRKSERKIKELQFQSEEDQKHQASSILPVQFLHR